MIKIKTYENINWKKQIESNKTKVEIAKEFNINYATVISYFKKNGAIIRSRPKYEGHKKHWNEPLQTTSLKHLNGGETIKPKRKLGYPPLFLKKLNEVQNG